MIILFYIGKKCLIFDIIIGFINIYFIDEDCVLLKYIDLGYWYDYFCFKLDFLGFVYENFLYVCEYSM